MSYLLFLFNWENVISTITSFLYLCEKLKKLTFYNSFGCSYLLELTVLKTFIVNNFLIKDMQTKIYPLD